MICTDVLGSDVGRFVPLEFELPQEATVRDAHLRECIALDFVYPGDTRGEATELTLERTNFGQHVRLSGDQVFVDRLPFVPEALRRSFGAHPITAFFQGRLPALLCVLVTPDGLSERSRNE